MNEHCKTRQMAAMMLVRGFTHHWKMQQVKDAIGGVDAEESHAIAEFLPPYDARYLYRTPVRAYIAANWPKLNTYLLANEKNTDSLLRIIPQVEKLQFKGKCGVGLSSSDRREVKKDREELRRVSAANNAARRQQLSTQRGAWNVCK